MNILSISPKLTDIEWRLLWRVATYNKWGNPSGAMLPGEDWAKQVGSEERTKLMLLNRNVLIMRLKKRMAFGMPEAREHSLMSKLTSTT